MKKFILNIPLILSFSTLSLLTSCEGGGNGMTATHTVAGDVEGSLAAFNQVWNTNPCALLPTTGNPLPIGAILVGIGGAQSSQRAAVYGGRPDMAYTNSIPDLPPNYIVSGNPYEEYGIIHNRGINLIISSGGADSTLN